MRRAIPPRTNGNNRIRGVTIKACTRIRRSLPPRLSLLHDSFPLSIFALRFGIFLPPRVNIAFVKGDERHPRISRARSPLHSGHGTVKKGLRLLPRFFSFAITPVPPLLLKRQTLNLPGEERNSRLCSRNAPRSTLTRQDQRAMFLRAVMQEDISHRYQ